MNVFFSVILLWLQNFRAKIFLNALIIFEKMNVNILQKNHLVNFCVCTVMCYDVYCLWRRYIMLNVLAKN